MMAVLGKMIEHQAAMLQTIQRMEREVEHTRAHQVALAAILESLSEPGTPVVSIEPPSVSGSTTSSVSALADAGRCDDV